MRDDRYRFEAGGDESHWDSIRRLADEVGMAVAVDEHRIELLKKAHVPVVASRAVMTRGQFVSALLAGGVRPS